jgi:prefoldin subunit 5
VPDRARQRLRRDVDEIARLMEDFAAELEKLDEALKTLAAYLGRMRSRTGGEQERVLH